MRYLFLAMSILLAPLASARAQVSIGIGIATPGVSIGINMPVYPELVQVPGYPVYYDPRADSNYFFYDGMYWVYQGDTWYASSWYNGPWYVVEPLHVPLYVLRVPVRYYRAPPPYFREWRPDGPPRWGERWGRGWERRRHGWDHWDRREAPRPAPLPLYQRRYSGDRYPRDPEQFRAIRSENYRYRPREELTRRYYQRQEGPGRPPAEYQRGPAPRRAPPPQREQMQPMRPPPGHGPRSGPGDRMQPVQPPPGHGSQPGPRGRDRGEEHEHR